MNTPSAVAPAARSERGCDAARKTGLGSFTHGRWAVPPRWEAGRPRSSSLTNTTPSASSLAGRVGAPRFRVPLWPTPMPSRARPGARRLTDAIDAADTAGCRVTRFVTQTATRALRAAGQERRRYPGVHRDARGIRDADHVVAEGIRRLGHRAHEGDVVRPEEETNLHLVPASHGDRSTPDDADLHRQPDGIDWAVPTEKGLELVIELLGASGLHPRTREAVPRMEGLDVAIDGLAIRHGFGLSSPADGDESSRF